MSLPDAAKPAPVQPTATNICLLFRQVRDGLAQRIEHDLAENGYPINLSQFLVLRKLDLLGPMSAIDLARAIDHNPGAMTRLLDRLETMGYLRRTPHAGDRRALRIELTEAGAAQSQQLTDCSARVLEAAQRSLSEIERDQLHDYLTRVLHALRDKN
jgi:DNA-binding MarR family transcriptional regulator